MRLLTALFLIPLLLNGQKGVTFSDEFNGTELDLGKWAPHDPNPVVGVSGRTPELPAVSGGQVHLKAGQTLSTFGLFSQVYGRIEIRLRLPVGRELRARVRLLPVPLAALPAIDVFTANWSDAGKIGFGNHWGTEQTERSLGDSFEAPPAGFHVIAVEWDRAGISWSVDGKERFRSNDGVAQAPMFLLMEAVGSGSETETLDVDYVHVLMPKLN